MATMFSTSDDDLEYHPPTREEVLAQLENWRQRLDKLYADVIAWLPPGEGYETEIRDDLTDESPMRQAGVPPQPVPELVVRQNGEVRLVFSPEACWIIGAAGRVIIKSGKYNHRLVNVDVPESGRWWVLHRRDWLRPESGKPLDIRWRRGVPFDQLALAELVRPVDG